MEQGNDSSSTPGASSSSVGMISTKCGENISKSADLDCVIISQEENLTTGRAQDIEGKEKPVKKQKILKSEVWNHFDRIESEIKGTKKVDAICKYCHTKFNGASDQGTTHLKNHTKTCRMKLIKVPISQMLLGKQASSEDSRPKVGVHKFDNASNNLGMLLGIKSWLNGKRALVHNGDMFHMRCVPHILNLIVKSGLEMLDHLVEKIQKTAKYIGSSAQRDEKFTLALSQTKLNTKRRIPYDVDTRWNSTYEMIAASLELRPAIDRLKELDPDFKCLPSEQEWENGKKVCDCLKIFSDITKKHSGVKYPTANLYFIDVIQIRRSIKMWAESSDDWISAMGNKMQIKFDKYWEECNKLLTVAVILDPRYKMAIVSYAYRGIFDIHADFHVDEIREFLIEIFNEYSEKYASSRGFVANSGNASVGSSSSVGGEWLGGFQDFIASSNLRENTKKSELDEYLEEGLFPMDKEVEFDILHWWKLNGPKFPILARMAQDILAIPTSSVASENSFSKCRRIITDTRSSLNDDSIETLMCVKDWLPDLKDGNESGKTSEDEVINDLDNEWDLDF